LKCDNRNRLLSEMAGIVRTGTFVRVSVRAGDVRENE
jgi:hypothetical protein